MAKRSPTQTPPAGPRGIMLPWRRFRRDRRGVAAVEFALIVPLLLALYLGTMEVSNGVSLNKRVARAASNVADLVAQQDQVTRAQLHAIMDVGESVLFPYNADNPRITIVGVDVDDDHAQGGKVVWSRRLQKSGNHTRPFARNSDIRVPNRLRVDDSFLIMARVDVTYLPIVTWVTDRGPDGRPTGIRLTETFWLQPRLVERIDCTNC